MQRKWLFYQAHPFRPPCVPQNPNYPGGVELNQRPNSGNDNHKLHRQKPSSNSSPIKSALQFQQKPKGANSSFYTDLDIL